MTKSEVSPRPATSELGKRSQLLEDSQAANSIEVTIRSKALKFLEFKESLNGLAPHKTQTKSEILSENCFMEGLPNL